MLTCRHCGEQFVIGKGYFGNYRVPYCNENFPKELDEFYEKHSMGECCGDANCSDDAKDHYVILEQSDKFESKNTNYERIKTMPFDFFAEFIEKDMLELDGSCIKAYHKCEYVIACGSCVNAPKCIKQWLESEVTE